LQVVVGLQTVLATDLHVVLVGGCSGRLDHAMQVSCCFVVCVHGRGSHGLCVCVYVYVDVHTCPVYVLVSVFQ
jgi:hypothetical protein